MKNRNPALITLGIASLLLTGCAAAANPGTENSPPASTAAPTAAPGTDHTNGHNPASSQATDSTAGGPSEASLMVCGDQPKDRLKAILGLDTAPHTINDWANNTFTCTYHLEQGALKISVKEAADQASARTSFDADQALAKNAKPIEGLANLGFPAYETAEGAAVFQKDSFVLTVDASGLPATLGPNNITRNALAYQLSTTILACWVEHH